MQRCYDDEIAPKERHSAVRAAQWWARDAEFLHLGFECAALNLWTENESGNLLEIQGNLSESLW